LKIFLLLFATFTLLFAQGTPDTLYIGAGPYIQTQPYKGASSKITPSPVIFFDNHIFYIRWSRVGVYVAGAAHDNYSWGLSIAAQPRPYGYNSGDSDALKGMSNKSNSIEAGPSLDVKYKSYFFNIAVFHDILDKSNSYMSQLEVGKKISYRALTLYPSFFIIYYADRFNNYYYGVNHNEATLTRPYYKADGGVNYAFETYIKYTLTPKYSLLANLRAEYLNQNIRHSPIVHSHYIYSSLLSVMYKFTF
jgi:MipA family protein